MDRFIVVKYADTDFKRKDLKSSMDRFIVFAPHDIENITAFKIQYG